MVLDTDYETYSIVYSCSDYMDTVSFDMLWILAREREISDDLMLSLVDKINQKVPEYGFFQNHLMCHQSDWCPYDSRPQNKSDGDK
mmetsp:Transcript_35107/g.46210  ORF Transcript_35107/g.46210 Transcript_35107/m.46210 type:complete len:86 (-) Transcript_35107:170-427(-)